MANALPPSASVAHAQEGEKLFAPSAERNCQVLVELLLDHAPRAGSALEIASGTGQHVAAFARALPNLHWQPTEIDPARCASINAYAAEMNVSNIAPAVLLNATKKGWGATMPSKDLITLANLLHLIPRDETRTLIREAAEALTTAGMLILYGPFKRAGVLTSAGDQKFDAELRAADPSIGYKDDLDIAATLRDVGFTTAQTIDMPANNLAFIARKS